MSKRVLFISAKQVKEQSTLEMNTDDKILSAIIWDAQNLYLKSVLGNELYNTVADTVSNIATNPSFLVDSTIKELLDGYIAPYLIYASLSDWIVSANYKLTNKGILKLNDSSATNVSPDELEYAKDVYDNKTESYKQILIKYLKKEKITDEKPSNNAGVVSGWFLEN